MVLERGSAVQRSAVSSAQGLQLGQQPHSSQAAERRSAVKTRRGKRTGRLGEQEYR